MLAYCYQVSRFNYLFMITVVGGDLDLSRHQYLHEDVITCVSSYQWILHVDWWVDFVYFTNLPFSMEIYAYLYNNNVIQRSFNVIDQVPGWLFVWSLVHPPS